ncbi:MAG: hypothetical protein ACRCYV_03525, partial [Aeromonas sp.]
GLVPTTTALHEYVARGFPHSVAWASGRLVDKAEEMIGAWTKNDTAQAASRPPKLPVILVAVGNDFIPISASMGAPIADEIDVQMPNDPKQRWFKLKLAAGELRAQVVIFAHEEATAKSLAAQLALYLSSPSRRGFKAHFAYAGADHPFPVLIEAPDSSAMSVDTGAKNLKALAIDLNLICHVPLLSAPQEGEANDGLGVPGTADPAGFPLTREVSAQGQEAAP